MGREDYVRPPLVASEPASRGWAAWRFRLVLLLLAAAVVTALVLIWLAVTGSGEVNPGITPEG